MRSKLAYFIILSSFLNCSLQAILLTPDGISTLVPSGSNSPTAPYTDDLLLDTITFGGVTFDADLDQIITVASLYVESGRANINAEWGDDDTSSDGNPIPFERFGLDPADQESVDPAIQDLALASAFSSRSLTEGNDGEGTGSVFRITFSAGVSDNDSAIDSVPEIVLFERGNNDTTSIRAIIGGTFLAPIYAPTTVTINPNQMWNTGLLVDTTEIGASQELAAIGIDLNDFGATGTIFGLEIDTNGGDLSGIFATIQNESTQVDPSVPEVLNNPLGTVPEPSALSLIFGLCSLGLTISRRKRLS